LTFLDDRTRTRRDHEKYLTLIEAIAFLHQYQRPVQRDSRGLDYIEATVEDIATANRIAGEVLGRSLDELPPQTRRLLALVDEMVLQQCRRLKIQRSDYRFGRREVRQHSGWSDFQVRVHLDRLMQMEYVLAHRGARGQCFVYELLYAGEGHDGNRFIMGLFDPVKLGYDGKFEGQKEKFEGPLSPQSGANEGGLRGAKNGVNLSKHVASAPVPQNGAEKHTTLHAR
jgi:DNA primase